MNGHIFDYSDSGCNFIFKDILAGSEDLVKENTSVELKLA
jgi:hypothetical protein